VEYYVLFSRNDPDAQYHADILDRGIRELKKNGRYKEILESISSPDLKQSLCTADFI